MTQNTTPAQRPRLAAVITAYKRLLHGQHVVDRFLDGYGWAGTFHHPAMDVVSLYVDQSDGRGRFDPGATGPPSNHEGLPNHRGNPDPRHQQAGRRWSRRGRRAWYLPAHRNRDHEASPLRILRADHQGLPRQRPLSSLLQRQRALLQVGLVEADGRHLPQMGFPLQGGSSLAVTWRIPSVEFPLGATVHEAVSVGYGGMGSYDFHGLETIHCMVERRKGGETGVEWLQTYRGDGFWTAWQQGVWPEALVKAALCRSSTLAPASATFTDTFPTLEQMRALVPDPVAYHYQHRDGLRCTMLLMNGLVRDFTFAAAIEGQPKPFSTQMYLPMPDGRTTLASFFSPLVYNAEQMFLTGKAQYPIERTLLTSGLLLAGVDSGFQGMKRLETPNLAAVHYQPNPESTYWRS